MVKVGETTRIGLGIGQGSLVQVAWVYAFKLLGHVPYAACVRLIDLQRFNVNFNHHHPITMFRRQYWTTRAVSTRSNPFHMFTTP
jgi:hypothetical protein